MIGLRLGVGISLVLLGGGVYADDANSKNVNHPRGEIQQFEQGKKIAIVVGVKNYDRQNTGFRQLDYAQDDAEKVAGVLKKLGYKTELLVNDQASRGIILLRIRELSKTLRDGEGTMVFYFSGHGFAAGRDNYLATWGSVATLLQNDGLGISEVAQTIRDAKVRRAVLLVDACRDEPMPGKKGGEGGFEDVDTGEGVQVLYSTRLGSVSWENDALKQGVFSHFLLQGLSGQGAQNGLVTFNSLATYVENEVTDWTASNMSETQQPFRRTDGDVQGDFVLARLAGGEPVPPPQPASVSEPVAAVVPVPPAAPAKKSFEPDMIAIPAGKFTMGCDGKRDDVEGGCSDDEKPAHQVTLNAFKMGKYEVTFDQWDACEKAKACPHAEDAGWGRGNLPVINVSWDDITQKYIPWLNQETGESYRLPTEAEWEYAARGGTDTAYPWGNAIGKGNANCYKDLCGDKFEYTAPVGSFAANGYGLSDMNGNVWEWCQDWYAVDYYASSPASNPKGAASGPYRVLRGGSWYRIALLVRSANRDGTTQVYRGSDNGFRLVLP